MRKIARKVRKVSKKPSRSTLTRKADALAGKWFRDSGRCFAAGERIPCDGNFEWAHLKSRSVGVIRHSPLNAACLCSAHHRLFTQNPDLFTEWVENKWPGRWQALNDLVIEFRRTRAKPDLDYWIGWYSTRTDNAWVFFTKGLDKREEW